MRFSLRLGCWTPLSGYLAFYMSLFSVAARLPYLNRSAGKIDVNRILSPLHTTNSFEFSVSLETGNSHWLNSDATCQKTAITPLITSSKDIRNRVNFKVKRAPRRLRFEWLSLKRGTGNGERGTGNGERGIFKTGNL